MYESFFGLSQRPFSATPITGRYYPAAASEAAHQSLVRCIQRSEGVGLLIGPTGTGKSLICQLVSEHFANQIEIVHLNSGHLGTRRALLQAVLFELGLPYREMDEGELRLALIDHLAQTESHPGGVLLVIDEAQTLPMRPLDEVRLISNVVRHGLPRVRLMLAGSPELEERFTSPKLESFNQRITARCYLESFTHDETAQFMRFQIEVCGGNPDQVFLSDAYAAVHRATDGIPRLVNQVCDHAMILGYAGGRPQLDGMSIESAWAELQQLPTPWNQSSRTKGETAEEGRDVIEFGSLDEIPRVDAAQTDQFDAVDDTLLSSEFVETGDLAEDGEGESVEFGGGESVEFGGAETAEADDIVEFGGSEKVEAVDSFAPLPSSEAAIIRVDDKQSVHDCTGTSENLDTTRQLDLIEQHLDAVAEELDGSTECPDDRDGGYSISSEGRTEAPTRAVEETRDHGPFLEEEIIIDRYAELDAKDVDKRLHVTSTGGSELSALLQPRTEATDPSRRVVADNPSPTSSTVEMWPDIGTDIGTEIGSEADSPLLVTPIGDPRIQGDSQQDTWNDLEENIPSAEETLPAEFETQASWQPLSETTIALATREAPREGCIDRSDSLADALNPGEINDPSDQQANLRSDGGGRDADNDSDADLLLVEQDSEGEETPGPGVIRQDYRQLFARLRSE